MTNISIFFVALLTFTTHAVEHEFNGLFDLNLSHTQGLQSYLEGNYGKLRFKDTNELTISQVALNYTLDWENTLSLHTLANGYADNAKNGVGLTELFAQYKSLPFESGYRIKIRAGLMYPKVSMTNVMTGWSSPYTLNYSMINSWIAEEVRHEGVEFSVIHLGKYTNSEHDFKFNLTAFQSNDPTGAMIAWHGWIMTNRQTLRHEKLALPNSHIGFVPNESDVYLELDNKIGYQISSQWTWHGNGRFEIGIYDNNADPRVVENVQWAWRTKFVHLGIKWHLPQKVDFIAQYLKGDTLMQSRSGKKDLVNNDFDSTYIMLTKKNNLHRVSIRAEVFSVKDNDLLTFDDNNEDGEALTVNYNYRLNKHTYLNAEYNWVNSKRPSRAITNSPTKLIERKFQLSYRYYY